MICWDFLFLFDATFNIRSPHNLKEAQVVMNSNGVTPDLERLRLVGGSKSVLQLVLVTPHTAGVELFSLKVITA